MKISRRTFIAGGIAAALGSWLYLDNEPMEPAPVISGEVLCDLHAHPSNQKPLDEILEMLGSPGLVGLMQRPRAHTILTYEQAWNLVKNDPQAHEITPGQLAKFREGYFMRAQELSAGFHHIIALGFEGPYFPNFSTAQEAIEKIQLRGGLTVLAHPYSIPGGAGFRLPTLQEEEKIEELCSKVDLLETHNAHNIRTYVPGIDNMHIANEHAVQLAESRCDSLRKHIIPGVVGSDTHNELNQAKICGVYIKEESLESMKRLRSDLLAGEFRTYGSAQDGPYVSRWSFLKGLFF